MKKLSILCVICIMLQVFAGGAAFPAGLMEAEAGGENDFSVEERKNTPSSDLYRELYKQKIEEESKDMNFSLIYLDDDDVPELVVHALRSESYSIYTVRDGALFRLVNLTNAIGLDYYERSGVICEPRSLNDKDDERGYEWRHYQVSKERMILNNSVPILVLTYEASFDSQGVYMYMGSLDYKYKGRKSSNDVSYEEMCEKIGIADKERKPVCKGNGIGRKEAVWLLSGSGTQKSAFFRLWRNAGDSYREIYKKKLEETPDDKSISLIYLDDDDIPELVIRGDESKIPSYSIYTVRNGVLLQLVGSMETESLYYCERRGIIAASEGWASNCIEKKDSYYRVSVNQTFTDGSQPLLERSNAVLYNEDGDYVGEDDAVHYFYQGQETNQAAYEYAREKLGIAEEFEKIVCTGNAMEQEIALELLK